MGPHPIVEISFHIYILYIITQIYSTCAIAGVCGLYLEHPRRCSYLLVEAIFVRECFLPKFLIFLFFLPVLLYRI